MVMDLNRLTTEQLVSLFKRRSVPQEAFDLLKFMQSSLKRHSNINANTFGFLKV